MSIINLNDVQTRLPELISGMTPGEQIVIAKDGEPVATLTRNSANYWPCKAGSAKDTKHWMAPDFDAPLDDFREHME